MAQIDEVFQECDESGNGNGLLARAGLKAFFEKMNEKAVKEGLKGRDITETWMDIAWPVFNGYKEDTDGVSKDDLIETMFDVESATRPK